MSVLKRAQQWGTFAQIWHLYDATWQDPFKSAKMIAHILRGQYKPMYHPLNLCGDHVVIINSNDIALSGDEWVKRMYFHHTTYHGGASWTKAWEIHKRNPTMVMEKAVYTALGNRLSRRYAMPRLHIYYNDEIPEKIKVNISNQLRQLRPVPKRLEEISAEEIENFPQLVKLPETYVLR